MCPRRPQVREDEEAHPFNVKELPCVRNYMLCAGCGARIAYKRHAKTCDEKSLHYIFYGFRISVYQLIAVFKALVSRLDNVAADLITKILAAVIMAKAALEILKFLE